MLMTSAKVFETNLEHLTKNQYGYNHSIKFIHASDIHLGSHQYRNDYRANDFIFAFEEIFIFSSYPSSGFFVIGGRCFYILRNATWEINQNS